MEGSGLFQISAAASSVGAFREKRCLNFRFRRLQRRSFPEVVDSRLVEVSGKRILSQVAPHR